ncbi:MAG: LamG domain-containing protein, partial [Cytophagaceae bacterium]|nr:LamG domain-containing protein [Cytophagaceae bacterium]
MLANNRWYHVAAVVGPGLVQLYVDGQRVAQSAVLSGYIPSRRAWRVGESPFEDRRRFKGAIDELRIWNKPRTQAEIQRDMTALLEGNEPGLVAYFPMNKAAGNGPLNKVNNAVTGEFQRNESDSQAPGYTRILNDVGIERIDGPDVFTARKGPSRVKLTVRNYGANAVRFIPLVYVLNGKEVWRDTLRQTLEAGVSYAHKTLVPLDCAPNDSSQLAICTALPTDTWARNDTAQVLYRKP